MSVKRENGQPEFLAVRNSNVLRTYVQVQALAQGSGAGITTGIYPHTGTM